MQGGRGEEATKEVDETVSLLVSRSYLEVCTCMYARSSSMYNTTILLLILDTALRIHASALFVSGSLLQECGIYSVEMNH